MSRGSSPLSSGPNSSLISVVSAWFCAMPPTCAFASPQPVMPHSVSIRTMVPSNDRVRSKSLVCCRSSGIGMCTQYASTDLIFIAVSATGIVDRHSFSRLCAPGYSGTTPRGSAMRHIVVLGAGFAGLIAAVGAARKLAELKIPRSDIAITIVNRDPWHSIRVRNYETDLSGVRVPLADVMGPIGVDVAIGEVTGLDCARREIACRAEGHTTTLPYDRLVFALGSELG